LGGSRPGSLPLDDRFAASLIAVLDMDADLLDASGQGDLADQLRSYVGELRQVHAQGPEQDVTVFLAPGISPRELDHVRDLLMASPLVAGVEFESQQEAYETFVEEFEDNPELIEQVSPRDMPPSFRLTLAEPRPEAIRGLLDGVAGVDEIRTFEPTRYPTPPDSIQDACSVLQQILDTSS
jgi:hypothetical protein